jgi:hypothetical protein
MSRKSLSVERHEDREGKNGSYTRRRRNYNAAVRPVKNKPWGGPETARLNRLGITPMSESLPVGQVVAEDAKPVAHVTRRRKADRATA